MTAYYNEHDKHAAAWLRELIRSSLITPGEVDERDIRLVRADDLRGFTQCHFFAGIGVWSYALRKAGWQDDTPVWTGSCPCQPFSAAGAGEGFRDERDLWPAFFNLIRECRPVVVIGEQVSGKSGLAWLDLVYADLETEFYTVGAISAPACSVGAPHRRERIYFVADASSAGMRKDVGALRRERQDIASDRQRLWDGVGAGVATGGMADAECAERGANGQRRNVPGGREQTPAEPGGNGAALGVEHADEAGRGEQWSERLLDRERPAQRDHVDGRGAVNGFWRNAEWLPCRDGKARPTEPGTFPLVDGAPARVVRLRGYGNAINAEQAKEFVQAYMSL